MSRTAAELIVEAIRVKPALCLGLPTGNTPLGMYEELLRFYRGEGLDFSGLRTFNLDEYLGLPRDDPHSFAAYMCEQFFQYVNVPAENIHFPSLEVDYEKEITDAGGIDVLIVGIAANGHIAFNEPGSRFESRTREVALAPETIANIQREFGSTNVPPRAVTMGIATILDSRTIVLLASGAAKRDIVQRALHGPVSEAVPASALQSHPSVIVILDEAAAG